MGDDGYVNVPLQFSFPFYGQTFANSWMYDNGVVSFLSPETPGALSPWQWSATPLSQSPGNYFIAPLWADLAPVAGTTYTTQGTAQYQRYNWNNIAEYYSIGSGTGLRLNTFSLEIRPDGTYTATYNAINLQTSNISIGSVGNASAGEYHQVYNALAGTQLSSMQNWTHSTYTPPPPDPCATNPQSSPTCPGYVAPIIEVEVVQQITKQPTVVDSTQTNFTTVDAGGVTIDATGQVSAPTPVPDSTKESIKAATEETTRETRTTPTLRPRVAAIVRDAIENRVALAVVRESIETSTESSGVSIDSGTGLIITRVLSFNNEDERKEDTRRTTVNNSTTNPLNTTSTMNLVQEEKPNTGPSVRNGGSVDGMRETVSIASLTSGTNLDSYRSMQLNDSKFYDPKEIYKGQQTVDNHRASRGLFGANDARHADMVNQQYK